MMANLLMLINNDFFKLFVILCSLTLFVVLVKNFFDKKRIQNKVFIGKFEDNSKGDNFQHFNPQRKIEIHVENLDPKFELIAKLESSSKTKFPSLAIDELENFIRVGQKSIRLSDRVLGSLGTFTDFYVGMLLVNRHGSLTLIEHIEFTETLNQIAKEFDLKLCVDDYSNIVKKLNPLKSKIYDLDDKLTLTIQFDELPSKIAMDRFADKFNMAKYAEDRFVNVNKFGYSQFSIVPADYVYALNIVMDLPRVEDPEKVFINMFEATERLAFQFDGRITDKNGIELKNDSKAAILNQVLNKIQLLKQFGLPPGGNLSMRVFN